jgi:hypothetical protein
MASIVYKFKYSVTILILILILIIVIIFLWAINQYYFKNIVNITTNNSDHYHKQLSSLESRLGWWYPLSSKESFRIDHGSDYFQFFRRLGTPYTVVALNNTDQAIGTSTAILRDISLNSDKSGIKKRVWYWCDLKVDEKYRGDGIPIKMLLKNVWRICQSRRIYGITMGNGEKVVRLASHIPFINYRKVARLWIYNVDADTMRQIHSLMESVRGPIRYLSLGGVKDLVLKSTGKSYKVKHLQYGEDAVGDNGIEDGYSYMFCIVENNPLRQKLESFYNVKTDIEAQILAANMGDTNWEFINTADI